MSAKNRDNKNRWRNITVGFRVSPEENERINKAVALSGLPKHRPAIDNGRYPAGGGNYTDKSKNGCI